MSRRVVIVGGGVIGLCSAYYCRMRGYQVTVVDRHGVQRDGCSFGNAGMIVPSHFMPLAAPGMVALGLRWMANPESPFYIRPRASWELLRWGYRFWRACRASHVARAAPLLRDLNLASRACYEQLSRQLGDTFGLTKRGMLMLCRSQQALDEEAHMAEKARELGLSAEVLDVRATGEYEPDVRLDICGSVYFPSDCHLNPARFVNELQDRLARDGCDFLWDTEVTGIEQRGRHIAALQTNRGEVEGDEFVVAGGSWSTSLARHLGLSLPMQAGKGYSLTLEHPRQLPQHCAILVEARVAVTPLGSALRFGGTMEIAGLDESINPVRVRGIIKSARQYFPDFQEEDFAHVPPWRGLRPCSPDGLPYLGRTAFSDNLIVATGHAMMGLSLGPITGQLVAELLAGEPTSLDLRLLSPDRYNGSIAVSSS